MIVDELVTLLEFDVKGKEKADAFDGVLEKIEQSAKGLLVAVGAAITSVGYFADRVSKEITDNYEWAKSVGVAVDSYQRFEHVAEIVGGSLDDIKGDLESWVRTAKASGMTLEQVYEREADSIRGMSAEQSKTLLSARGYSQTSIRMLQQGKEELKKYLSQAQVIPEAHLKAAKEYAVTWREATFEIRKIMQSAVASALPYIQNILKGVRDFIQTNKELFKSSIIVFFKSLAIVLVTFLKPLKAIINLLFFFLRIFDKITLGAGKYIIVIMGLAAAFTALSIALTIKTMRGVFSLLGALPNLLTSFNAFLPVLNQFIVKLTTIGIGQATLNSELSAATGAWFANTAAVWANTKASMIHTWQKIKEVFVYKAHLFTIKSMSKAIAELTAKLLVGLAKAIAKTIVQVISLTLHFVRLTFQISAKLLLFIGKLIIALGVGLVGAIRQLILSIKSLNVSILKNLVAPIVTAAHAIWATMIPVITALIVKIKLLSLAILANPITWTIAGVVAAIAVLIGLVYLVWKYSDNIKVAWEKVSDSCKRFFKSIKDGAQTIYFWLVNGVMKIADFISDIGDKVWSGIKDMFAAGINGIIKILNKLPKVNIPLIGSDEDSNKEGLQKVRERLNPEGAVLANYSGRATIPNNNYQNNRSYVDQRNITINTNATSGPAIASYMRSNDLIRGGYGMGGAV